MTDRQGPLALIVLDGFGYSPVREGNAIALASMPFYNEILEKYPHTLLQASGECVGLPPGVMGNSNVGHLCLGAGRVLRTDVERINYEIASGEFLQNVALNHAMDNALKNNRALHLMGLLSDGLVHSSQEHLYALLRMAHDKGLQRVYVHPFLDGRDTPPMSAYGYVEALQVRCAEIGCGRIASVCGRYYAMDRDTRWERTERAYRMLTKAEGQRVIDPVAAIKESYERSVSDEFIEPMVVTRARDEGEPVAVIEEGDSIIFFNFRADRARQITSALNTPGFDAFDVSHRPPVEYVCFAEYDKTFNLPVAFLPTQPDNILADVFAAVGVRNYRMAETEKYAHVTYFFNGGTEREYPHERRLLVPSPKVATYDLAPEMSAFKLTDKILRAIDEGETDVFIINFANPDMVGHTGNLAKTIEAVQHVDNCLGWITKALRPLRGRAIITADHGNCEQMIDPATGGPHTAHTTYDVELIVVDDRFRGKKLVEGGRLADVAPTALSMMGLTQPAEMNGRSLIG